MKCTLRLAPENADGAAPSTAEARTSERHPCELPTACRSLAGWQDRDFSWAGELRDISLGGMGLILNRRFEPGTLLMVELDTPAGRESLLSRVVHARPLGDQKWLLGCALARPLNRQKLQALLSGPPHTPAPEAATEVEAPPLDWLSAQGVAEGLPALLRRATAKQRFFLLQDAVLEGAPPGGWPARVAVRRFHLIDCWPLEEGATILVRRRGAKDHGEGVRLRVRSCSQQDGSWVISYELPEEAPAEFLRLLGHPSP